MVLEHIFSEEMLERRPFIAFLLGIGYSILGIILAKLLFPKDPALVAVAFTSLLLLPELYKIFSIEAKQERADKGRVTWRDLWNDDSDIFLIYVFMFIGILLTYSVATILLPSFTTNTLFEQQLAIRGGYSGAAMATGQAIEFTSGLYWSLLKNNFKVMFVIFIIALLTGDGAIFLITWNASVWGTIFGITAKHAALVAGVNPFVYFFIVIGIVSVHMLLEAASYFCAAIAGSVLSKGFLMEKVGSKFFGKIVTFNMMLLLVGLGFLLLGVFVETLVLNNVTTYQQIIQQSFEYAARARQAI